MNTLTIVGLILLGMFLVYVIHTTLIAIALGAWLGSLKGRIIKK